MTRRRIAALTAALAILATALPLTASAAGPRISDRAERSVAGGRQLRIDPALTRATGPTSAIVSLVGQPSAKVKGAAAQRARAARLSAEQAGVVAVLKAAEPSARVVGRTRVATNTILVTATPSALLRLAADPRVARVSRPRMFERHLSDTVPYIGARSIVGRSPSDGTGIEVAVLDSGIDYTHKAFGGAGTAAAYFAAYGRRVGARESSLRGSYFPTTKVVDGYDFVGEKWPESREIKPDPDPIDCSPTHFPCDGGHGTHVADIIAGITSDASSGVAPGAKLVAVKVCSALASACSHEAILLGIDFSLDRDGDGDTEDAVDVINLSLGSDFGGSTQDNTEIVALENASAAGVVVVASAGNGGDKPYVTGSPASAPSTISVAQTEVPSSTGFVMEVGPLAAAREAVRQVWSGPLTGEVTGIPQYGNGAGGNLNGCLPLAGGSATGKIVIVDRGSCSFTAKISNVAAGGAALGIIRLTAPGDPFSGGFAVEDCSECDSIPGYMISQADGADLTAGTVPVTFDPQNSFGLEKHVVSSSARGPEAYGNALKPEIGAPGASVSASVGTGTGTEEFGGTSGAAPMVAGSVAILRAARPELETPLQIKAALMNTAETDVMNKAVAFGGGKAPISRIGAGEVRVADAVATDTIAYDQNGTSAALSFGFVDVSSGTVTLRRTIQVDNLGPSNRSYGVTSSFRFPNDAASGAVSVEVPTSISASAGGGTSFEVVMTITASALRPWALDSGRKGIDAATLAELEYDGYITITGGTRTITVPWHVLPRKAAAVVPSASTVPAGGTVDLVNGGAGTAWISDFDLIAESGRATPSPVDDDLADVDLRYVGVRQIQGVDATTGLGCSVPYAIQFAITTWERQAHAIAPGAFDIDIDLAGGPRADAVVLNADYAGVGSIDDGRNYVYGVFGRAAPQRKFPTIHPMNSANRTLTVCGEQIGVDPRTREGRRAFGREVRIDVYAIDVYYSGEIRDATSATFTLGRDSFRVGDTFDGFSIASGATATPTVGILPGAPRTTGRVLLLTDHSLKASSAGASGGATQATEAIAITVGPAASAARQAPGRGVGTRASSLPLRVDAGSRRAWASARDGDRRTDAIDPSGRRR